jgi:glycine/D-amino acid oxidase-like deaminating enzyme
VLGAFRIDDVGRPIVGGAGALRGTGAVIHRRWALRHIRALFPQIGEVRLEREWHGRIGMTNDHLRRSHAATNMISLAGYNGRRIALGTVFGRELARHIVGEVLLDGMSRR